MRATRWLTITSAVFFLAAAIAPTGLARADTDDDAGQPIAVHADLHVGASWSYELSFDLLVSKGDESAEEMGKIVQSAILSLKADRVTPDGSFIIKGTFNRLTSLWSRAGEQHEFSWVRDEKKKPQADQKKPADQPEEKPAAPAFNPLEGRAPALDDAAIYQSVFETLAQSEFTIVVSPDGRVAHVGGFGSAIGMLSIAKDLDETALGVFLPPRFAEAIEPIWRADGAGDVKKIGDTWSRSRHVRFGRAGGIEINSAWRAASLKRETLNCQGAITAKAITPEKQSPTQPTLEVVRGQGEASLTWSLSDGALIEREERLDLALRWRLADLKTELHQLSTRRLRRAP